MTREDKTKSPISLSMGKLAIICTPGQTCTISSVSRHCGIPTLQPSGTREWQSIPRTRRVIPTSSRNRTHFTNATMTLAGTKRDFPLVESNRIRRNNERKLFQGLCKRYSNYQNSQTLVHVECGPIIERIV